MSRVDGVGVSRPLPSLLLLIDQAEWTRKSKNGIGKDIILYPKSTHVISMVRWRNGATESEASFEQRTTPLTTGSRKKLQFLCLLAPRCLRLPVSLIVLLMCACSTIILFYPVLQTFDSFASSVPHLETSHDYGTVIARPFAPWPKDDGLPCFESDIDLFNVPLLDTTTANVGFLYQKTEKCASTTSSGVALRIARNVAKRVGLETEMCDNRWSHGKSHFKNPGMYATRFRNRNQDKSFLWTMIREPTSRYVSHYFFSAVTGNKKEDPSVGSFRRFVSKWPRRLYNCLLSTRRSYNCEESELALTESVEELNQIINEYDFIGVTERYDESLVVLMMLLDLRLADILYFSSKQSGSSFISKGKRNECFTIAPTIMPEGLADFFDSEEWQARIHFDTLLHKAANRSLDLTIDSIGRHGVEEKVALFRHAQRVATEQCKGRVVLPCEEEGVQKRQDNETDCYRLDIGCGMECLDEVATELDLW